MGVIQQHGRDLGQSALACSQGSLIDQVGQLRTAEARCALCQRGGVHVVADGLFLQLSCLVSMRTKRSRELKRHHRCTNEEAAATTSGCVCTAALMAQEWRGS